MLKRVLILLLMLLLMWFVIFYNDQSNKQPNVVSHQEKSGQVKNQNNSDALKKPATNKKTPDDTPELLETTHDDTKSTRTYLKVFQDLQLAKECGNFYVNNHQQQGNYDYSMALRQAYQSMNKTDELPPVLQLDALEFFVQNCQNLKMDVFARAKINEEFPEYQFAYPVIVELRMELNRTKPKSAAETHLAGAIKYGSQWQQSFDQLISAARGENKHPPSIRKMMREEILTLRNDISALYQINPVDSEQLASLQQQIDDLHLKMEERLPASEEAMQQAKEAFIPVNALMEKNLKAPYPGSFAEIIKILQLKDQYDLRIGSISSNNHWAFYLKNYINWYQPPSYQIMQQTHTSDLDHFNLLIEPASLLFLCYLGDDCGPNSAHVRKYCLNTQSYFQPTYPSACGKSLIDFYTEDFLTANQWSDVSGLFDVMVNLYAQ
jgi:hypothetical protein